MKHILATLALTGTVFAQAAPEKDAASKAPSLKDARKQWKLARRDFKKLNKFEQMAVEDAREGYFASPCGKLVHPTLKTVAQHLNKAAEAAKDNEKFAELARDIAASADKISGRANAADDLDAAWTKAMKAEVDAKVEKNFKVLSDGDPRQRALKANVAAIHGALKTLEKMEAPEGARKHGATAMALTGNVAKCLDKVPATRLAPAKPAPKKTPT